MTTNSPPLRTSLILDQEALANAATKAGFDHTVFLAGPFIETHARKPRSSEKNRAKVLRYNLYHELTNFGWIVTMGEYEKLLTASEELLGPRNDAAIAELNHAKNTAHAIVMLPSSPGSFLELGAFAMHEKVCKKMLVVIDKRYEKDSPNYFNTGPIPRASKTGAQVCYVDYNDHSACWCLVKEFVTQQSYRVAEQRILSG